MFSKTSMFDGSQPFKVTKPIRLIELFAGIGAQAKALENLGIDFEHYRICEFDKYAVQSYNAVHGTDFKTSDITKINAADLGIAETDKYEYIVTYSFPCTDLSVAGKQAGMKKGSGTRSGLLWEIERLLKDCAELPQLLVMENVRQVINCDFGEWLSVLEKLGYHNYYKVLNAKDYGIPQNRERCFMLSILGDYYYEFPKEIPLELRLKDMLESKVDEKYYLSEKAIKGLNTHLERNKEKGNGFGWKPKDGNDIATTIKTEAGYRPDSNFIKEPHCEVVAQLNIPGRLESACRVHCINGIAPPCNTCGGGGRETKIAEPVLVGGVGEINFGTQFRQGNRIYDSSAIACALNASPVGNAGGNSYLYQLQNSRIRKLTPKECWRLMGFTDSDFDKAKASGVSDSQLYKQAGNSIVVKVLEAILKQLV